MIKSQTAILENALYQEQQKHYQNQITVITQNQDRISCIRHDLKIHNLAIEEYVNNQDYNGLRKYLDNSKQLIDTTENFINTKNANLDSLINFKLSQAVSFGAKISPVTNKMVSDFVDIFDLNTVIGNLLDNANEAVESAKEKIIALQIDSQEHSFSVICSNTYSKLPDNGQKTTKIDKSNHGFGLKSVQRVVDKYGGAMNVDVDEKHYTVSVILYREIK
jgi:sensor histidine kinase regulating citrate/malate metabolism